MSYFNLSVFKKNSPQKSKENKSKFPDENWKKEAIIALDERIAAYSQLTYLGLRQQIYKN